MKKKLDRPAPLWIERFGSALEMARMSKDTLLPSFSRVEQDNNIMTALVQAGIMRWPDPNVHAAEEPDHLFGNVRTELPKEFDYRHPFCFRFLPCVDKYLQFAMSVAPAFGDKPRTTEGRESSMLFSMHHFKKSGQPVYVIDDVLYLLLRDTALPEWPSARLNFPHTSMYVKVPDGVFSFSVNVDPEPQPVEGFFVTVNHTEGQPTEQREIVFLVCGKSSKGSADDNVAWSHIAVGPEYPINQLYLSGFEHAWANGNLVGGVELARDMIHVVLSLVLYLTAQHPVLEPVPPLVRKSFAEVRSPKQRETALQNQEKVLSGYSKLAFTYVGRHGKHEVKRPPVHTGRKLETGHEVSGHWKSIVHGEKRALRRHEWIQPYWRGPDFADSLEIKAAKVIHAQERS